jgi:hypothetical protein
MTPEERLTQRIKQSKGHEVEDASARMRATWAAAPPERHKDQSARAQALNEARWGYPADTTKEAKS